MGIAGVDGIAAIVELESLSTASGEDREGQNKRLERGRHEMVNGGGDTLRSPPCI